MLIFCDDTNTGRASTRRLFRRFLETIFNRLDVSKKGDLTLEDLVKGARTDPEFQSRLRVMDIDQADLEQLFEMMPGMTKWGRVEQISTEKPGYISILTTKSHPSQRPLQGPHRFFPTAEWMLLWGLCTALISGRVRLASRQSYSYACRLRGGCACKGQYWRQSGHFAFWMRLWKRVDAKKRWYLMSANLLAVRDNYHLRLFFLFPNSRSESQGLMKMLLGPSKRKSSSDRWVAGFTIPRQPRAS